MINKLSLDNEKRSVKKTIPIKKQEAIVPNRIFLIKLNGLQILKSKPRPHIPVRITQIVDVSLEGKLKTCDNNIVASISRTIIMAQGRALLIILTNKFPFTLSLLGSKASIKEGMPIVNTLVRVICMGIKG